MPPQSDGIVYFNVAFSNEGTVYTYPSCCVFREEPEILPTSAKSSFSIVRQFWQDLEQLLECFSGLTPERWLLDPLAQIPWHQKLTADLENGVKMKAFLGIDDVTSDNQSTISRYFPTKATRDYGKKNPEQNQSGLKKTIGKNSNPSSSRRTVNSKITNYFSAQHPNIKIRRTATKVTFKVDIISFLLLFLNLCSLKHGNNNYFFSSYF